MNITKLFHEALLADAAYVNLDSDMRGANLIDRLITREGITQAQASVKGVRAVLSDLY